MWLRKLLSAVLLVLLQTHWVFQTQSHPLDLFSPETFVHPKTDQTINGLELASHLKNILFPSPELDPKDIQVEKNKLRKHLKAYDGNTRLKAAKELVPLVSAEDSDWLLKAFLAQKRLHENQMTRLRESPTLTDGMGRMVLHYRESGRWKSVRPKENHHQTRMHLTEALIQTQSRQLAHQIFKLIANQRGSGSEYLLRVLGELGNLEMVPILRAMSLDSDTEELEAAVLKILYRKHGALSNLSVSIRTKPWLRRILKLDPKKREDQAYLKNLLEPILEILQIKIQVPMVSSFAFYVEQSEGFSPDKALAYMILSASLAAKNEKEFLENLKALNELISDLKNFEYQVRTGYNRVRGLRSDLVLAALPQMATLSRNAREFQEAVQREKEAISFERTHSQFLRTYLGWCSEDSMIFSGQFEMLYAVPFERPQVPQIKCLVLDADGVLWGGIVGEKGWKGVELDNRFLDFQRKILELKESGVLLALASKNDLENLESVFTNRKEMVLKLSDFTVVKANWKNKADNVRAIANELNIGGDSLAFIDDSPEERAVMRNMAPEVFVPELPKKIFYPGLAEAIGIDFVPEGTTQEDRRRAKLYEIRRHTELALQKGKSLEQSLHELEIELEIEEVKNVNDQDSISRVSQLTQRTNQFNLTHQRYRQSDIREFVRRENSRVFIVRLKNKFGDSGIVGALILRLPFLIKREEKKWDIDSFCLSCRVLGLGVEKAFLAYVAHQLQNEGVTHLFGKYNPTKRNQMVRDFYPSLGFEEIDNRAGRTGWEMELSQHQIEVPSWIQIKGWEPPKPSRDVWPGFEGLPGGQNLLACAL